MVTEEIMSCPIVSLHAAHLTNPCSGNSSLLFQAMLSDDLVAEAVNEKVETFYRKVRTRRPAADGSLGQIAVLFTQKRSKKTWFSSTEVCQILSQYRLALKLIIRTSQTGTSAL
jgi:hypothetical protein